MNFKRKFISVLTTVAFVSLSVMQGSAAVKVDQIKKEDPSKYFQDAGKYYILGDDILLDKNDPVHQNFINRVLTGSSKVSMSSFKSTQTNKWPNGSVPYYFDNTITATQKANIRNAMNTIEMACNVDFYETTSGDYRLRIQPNTDPNVAGSCTLGYIKSPSYYFSDAGEGVIIHELLHGLGYHHENQRYDAVSGGYISIDYSNIIEKYKSNFDLLPQNVCQIYGPYDYDSIMHYSSTAFRIDTSKVTIDSKGHTIGQRTRLSQGDRLSLIRVYGNTKNSYFAANIDGAGGKDMTVLSNWGIGVQNWNGSNLATMLYNFPGTWFGDWNFNPHDNVIRGVGDFDGNGSDDIVVTSPWGMAILTKSGSSFIPLVIAPNNTFFGGWRFNADVTVQAVADFNGDGKAEMFVKSPWGIGILGMSGNTLTSLVCAPNGTRFGGWLINTADNNFVGVGDFDGNNAKDIMVTSPWGVGILSIVGNTFTSLVCKPNDSFFGGWRFNRDVTVRSIADFNGDRKDEALVTSPWGIGILAQTGDTMTSPICAPNGTRFGGWLFNSLDNTICGAGDFDGNRTADIVVTSPWGVGILSMVGNTMTSPVCAPNDTFFGGWRFNRDTTVTSIADYTGDGRAEMLVTSPWGLGLLNLNGNTMNSPVCRSYDSAWWTTTR